MKIKGWIVKSLFIPVIVIVNVALAALSMTLLTGIVAV